jgi:hypothetical protein
MKTRHHIAIAAAIALSAVAVGGAIAATKLAPRHESQAVIDDAARELGVEPQELSNALKGALKNRVDAAVADGRLTKEQGERMKERIEADGMPPFGFGRFGPGHGERHVLFHAKLDVAAKYLGMTRAEVRAGLRSGKTLAQLARGRDKPVDGLVDALVADAERKLGADDEMLSDIRRRIENLVNGRAPRLRPPHFRGDGARTFFRLDVF